MKERSFIILIVILIIRLIRKKKDDATIVARVTEDFPDFKLCTQLRGGEKDLLKLIKQLRKIDD